MAKDKEPTAKQKHAARVKALEQQIKAAEAALAQRKEDLPAFEKAIEGKTGIGHKYAVKRFDKQKGLIEQLQTKVDKARGALRKLKDKTASE